MKLHLKVSPAPTGHVETQIVQGEGVAFSLAGQRKVDGVSDIEGKLGGIEGVLTGPGEVPETDAQLFSIGLMWGARNNHGRATDLRRRWGWRGWGQAQSHRRGLHIGGCTGARDHGKRRYRRKEYQHSQPFHHVPHSTALKTATPEAESSLDW